MPNEPEYASTWSGPTISSFCEAVGKRHAVTQLLLCWLREHFSASAGIEITELKELIWQHEALTGILIESIFRWNPRTTNKFPAIIVKPNATRDVKIGIGDTHPGSDQFGNTTHTTSRVGSHTVFCMGTEAQAELLAAEVDNELTEYAPVILKMTDLHTFRVMEIGGVAELEGHQEIFAVPITVAYAWNRRWKLRQQAPRWKTLGLSMLLK